MMVIFLQHFKGIIPYLQTSVVAFEMSAVCLIFVFVYYAPCPVAFFFFTSCINVFIQ